MFGVALAALSLTLVGCQVDNTPKSYDAIVERNFIDSCTANLPPKDSTTTTLASSTYCQCAYNVFKENVPYNDEARTGTLANYPESLTFVKLQDELANDPNKINELPQDVKAKIQACPKQPENVTTGTTGPVVGPAPAGSSSTTSQASGTTSSSTP